MGGNLFAVAVERFAKLLIFEFPHCQRKASRNQALCGLSDPAASALVTMEEL
jgi:hypothetical protein